MSQGSSHVDSEVPESGKEALVQVTQFGFEKVMFLLQDLLEDMERRKKKRMDKQKKKKEGRDTACVQTRVEEIEVKDTEELVNEENIEKDAVIDTVEVKDDEERIQEKDKAFEMDNVNLCEKDCDEDEESHKDGTEDKDDQDETEDKDDETENDPDTESDESVGTQVVPKVSTYISELGQIAR